MIQAYCDSIPANGQAVPDRAAMANVPESRPDTIVQ
jgi:hypothetical protein